MGRRSEQGAMSRPSWSAKEETNGFVHVHVSQNVQISIDANKHPDYQRRLRERGIVQSMSRKGSCIDSCIMESFFGTLKNEMFYGHESEFKTFEGLHEAIGKYINYYNNERIKSKTKWMPPSKSGEASMLSL